MFSKIYLLSYIYYIYIYTKGLPTMLDKGLRKNIKKKRRDGAVGNKLNEMGKLNMKQKK